MPFFGSKSSFAIEVDAIPVNQPPFYPRVVFGHICFWAAGQRLGDYDQTVILGAPVCILGDALIFEGERRDDMIDGKSKKEALALIHEALYELGTVGAEKTYAECMRLSRQFKKFDICTNSSEAFDGVFVVLIDVDNGNRFIWRGYENRDVQEVRLAAGEYENAVRAFLDWYRPIKRVRQVT